MPGLGGTRPRVWDLEKPILTAMAEASRAKLKDEKKKAKVQGSNGAVISSADSKEGAHLAE